MPLLPVDHHFGDARACVVVGAHHHAVGASRHDGEQVAGLKVQRRWWARKSPDSQIGPTISQSLVSPLRCDRNDVVPGVVRAGRARSFIAASTIAKFFASPGFRYSTRVSSAPALPTGVVPVQSMIFGLALQFLEQRLQVGSDGHRLRP